MPQIDQNELVARIEWNENIHVDENNRRVDDLMKQVDDRVTEHAAYVGMQDYILNGGSELSSNRSGTLFQDGKAIRNLFIAGIIREGDKREISVGCGYFLTSRNNL